MGVLSRTGNLEHEVHRVATTTQNCLAVYHALQTSGGDWEMAKRSACSGQPPAFCDNVQHYKAFVTSHSGGSDGHYLYELEQFERGLGAKGNADDNDKSGGGGAKGSHADKANTVHR